MEALLNRLLERPVGVTAFYVLLSALALTALLRLPVALLPSLAHPSLVVWTGWAEVPAEQVERGVTRPVEEAVAGTTGLRNLESRSQLGGSLVRLDFGWSTDLDLVVLEARQKLDRLIGVLPQGAERPVVLRVDPADRPMMVLALASSEAPGDGEESTPQDLIDLKQIGTDVVARRFEQIEGVARVRVTGGYEPQIEVGVQPDRMAAHGVDLTAIETALADANVTLAGGTVRRGPFRYPVEVSGELRNIREVAATVVSPPESPPVRLGEIATVRDGVAPRRGLVRLDGREVLLLLVERRSDANTVDTANEVREVLTDLRHELPGVALDVVVDESVFIEAAVAGVVQSLLGGGLLAVAILFLFLRRPRMLMAVAVAVPLSLALSLILFDLWNVSLNLISLSGLALGVGLLVDNAIVVVENIARLRERGMAPRKAAARGTVEVAGAITASTLTTLAVFLPLTFVDGLAGRLFRDQSLAVACSVGASLLVALTVVPLLASRDASVAATNRRASSAALGVYEGVLARVLAHPGRALVVALLFLVATSGIALWLPRQTVPQVEQGRLEVRLALPPDADLPLMEAHARHLEAYLARQPQVRRTLADLGERDDARLELDPRPPYEGSLTILMQPGASVRELAARIASRPRSPDLMVESRPVRTRLETLLAARSADLWIDLIGEDRRVSESMVEPLLEALGRRPELSNVARSDPRGAPSYEMVFDHDALARLNVRPEAVEAWLEAAARGREATRLRRMREDVPVVLRASRGGSMEALLGERVRVGDALVPLSAFVRSEHVTLPATLMRREQAPVVRLTADLSPGTSLQAGVRSIEETLARVVQAPVRARVGGANEAFRAGLKATGWSLLLSIALVYLILAAQLESLRQPLVVLAVVPLAVGGVALVLALTGQSWNLMSLTGCVVLVGIAVNDAIVKVDFINQRRRGGRSLEAALLEAGRDRFRPILMTTLTTGLGLLPLALGLGAGGDLQAPLAIAVAGGLCVATVMSLLLVPVVYRILCPEAKSR